MIEKNQLSLFIEEICSEKEVVFGGRASGLLTSHLKYLKSKNLFGKKIAVPVILCHAPVAGIIKAGWEPYFLEVDKVSGQVREDAIRQAQEAGVNCFLWVHMYGNPHNSERYIALSKDKDYYIIEDCCLSLGAKLGEAWAGSFGDASLFSFGATKPFDIGGGGAIAIKSEFSDFEVEKYSTVDGSAFKDSFYSRMIEFKKTGVVKPLRGLLEEYIPFLGEVELQEGVERFERKHFLNEIAERKKKVQIYIELLGNVIKPVVALEGAVPWRFVFRLEGIDGKKQLRIAELIRKEEIDVSNWYLPAHFMIRGKYCSSSSLEGGETFSNEVFQLWVDEKHNRKRIESNCEKILRIINDEV